MMAEAAQIPSNDQAGGDLELIMIDQPADQMGLLGGLRSVRRML
jgi:hypothetical protein